MKLRVFRCWLLRKCFLNVSKLWRQVLRPFEVLLKKQNILKCFYIKITSRTQWMRIDSLSDSSNKNGYFFPFLPSALLFNKSSSWNILLHLLGFIFLFYKKSSARMLWEKNSTICIVKSLYLGKQKKKKTPNISLHTLVSSDIILITVHARLPWLP